MSVAIIDRQGLEGKVVLVCSTRDHHNPPTGVRGTIHVRDDGADQPPIVQVEFDFPQMFRTRAHHRVIALSDEEVAELLASEHYGAYMVHLHGRLDPESPPGNG